MLTNRLGGVFGVQRTHAGINIQTIGIDAELGHLRAKFLENKRGEEIRRPMSAIDDQLQATQIRRPQTLLGIFDVAPAGIIDAVGLTDFIRTHCQGMGVG